MTQSSGGSLPVAAVILAAGAATRMGKLKQLLPYRGRTLVEHSIQQAIEAGFHPIIVVVGAEADAVRRVIATQPVDIVQNQQWQTGMGSSVAAAITQLQESGADSAAVAILLGDQPLITAEHLAEMRTLLHTRQNPVVAAQYGGTLGVPALFKRELFFMLASLPAEAGARHFLRDSALSVTEFPLPEAAVDIDTPADFSALESK